MYITKCRSYFRGQGRWQHTISQRNTTRLFKLSREKLNFDKVFLQARRQRVDDQTNIKETHLKPLL